MNIKLYRNWETFETWMEDELREMFEHYEPNGGCMKVITIKEPYVTPIALGEKHYETRSWKTNYRGEIYIHTAKTVLPDPVDRCKRIFPLGSIVLKANLTDCIEMDDDFIAEIAKDPDEYAFGFYEPGRYAWKLENVEILPIFVRAKGKLGIWKMKRFDSFEDYLDEMLSLGKYGGLECLKI